MAVLAPMPSARERIAAPAKTGLKRSSRAPKRRSLQRDSRCVSQLAERTFSITASIPPISRRAARWASSRVIPARIFSAADFSRKSRSSSSSSCSAWRLRKRPRRPAKRLVQRPMVSSRELRSGLQNPCDGGGLPLPLFGLAAQFLPASLCEGVVFRAPIIFRGLPFALDEASSLEAPERGEQRTGVGLENAVAELLNSLRDAPAVQRLERERFQDEHVQGTLHEGGGSDGHRWSFGLLLWRVERSIRRFSRLSREAYVLFGHATCMVLSGKRPRAGG